MTDHDNTCACGRPTRDVAYFCDNCGDRLAQALGDCPALDEELEISTSRQQGVDYRRVGGGSGGKKPAERPSPVSWGPSEARAHLKALLVSWALLCEAEGVRNSSPYPGLPDDNLAALSRWLMWRVDGLAFHEAGADAVDEITDAVKRCHRIIDRPADRQYLGTCKTCDSGRMYSRNGSRWATCETCDVGHDADEIRAKLLKELDDRLCTAAEIAHLSTYLGLKADRDQVRKRINQWSARGIIVKHPSLAAEVTFRFGEVYAKLARADYGGSVEETQESA